MMRPVQKLLIGLVLAFSFISLNAHAAVIWNGSGGGWDTASYSINLGSPAELCTRGLTSIPWIDPQPTSVTVSGSSLPTEPTNWQCDFSNGYYRLIVPTGTCDAGQTFNRTTGECSEPCTAGTPHSLRSYTGDIGTYINLNGCEAEYTDVTSCVPLVDGSGHICLYIYTDTGELGTGDPVDLTSASNEALSDENPTTPTISETEAIVPDDVATNPDGSTTQTTTTTETTTTGNSTGVSEDGTSTTITTDNGENTTTTTTQTTDIATDGTTVVTTSTTIVHHDDGSTSTTIEFSDGSNSSSISSPLDSTGTTTTTETTNPDGSSNSTTTQSGDQSGDGTADFPTPPGLDGNELKPLDDFITSIGELTPNEELTTPLTYDFNLGGGGTCTAGMYQFSLQGYSQNLDMCDSINLIRQGLYWFFALITAMFVFTTWTTSHRGA